MAKTKFYFYTSLLGVLLALTLPYALKMLGIIFMSPSVSILSQLELYMWVFAGSCLYALIRHFVQQNMQWFEIFTHELTHIIVALLFLRRIHSFHAEERSGVVTTSGNHDYALVPIALAPYCLPVFTYILLSIRCLIMDDGLWLYDILIGLTIGFHVLSFKHQTGNWQTDINQYPLWFSYTYIATALIVNFLIILVAFFPGYNVYTSLWRLISSLYINTIAFGCWIF